MTDSKLPDSNIFHSIFVGFVFADVFNATAREFPSMRFSILDGEHLGITFAEDEAGFLAGVLAGALTNTSIVGVMGNLPIPPVRRYVYGFLSGVQYINPAVTTYGTFNFDPIWSNSTIAEMNTRDFLSKNVDGELFAAAGGLGSQTIRNIASTGRWVIGVDNDESLTTFANKSDPASNFIFASALKNLDKATVILLNESHTGQFFPGNKILDSTVGGVGLSRCSSGLACSQLERSVIFQDVDASNSGCATVRKTDLGSLLSIVQTRIQGGGLTTVANGYIQGIKSKSNGTWADLPSFGRSPDGLQGHSQNFLQDNTFLIFGGQTPTGNISSDLWRYDYDAITWNLVNATGSFQPPGVQNHGAVYRRSAQELVISGGSARDNMVNGDVFKYSLATNQWTSVTTTGGGPGKRLRHSVALIGDRNMYVWGGQDDRFNLQNDFWYLDLETNQWTKIQTSGASGVDFPEARHSASMVAVNGTILLYGGNDGVSDGSKLWKFDVSLSKWTALSPGGVKPIGLSRAAAVEIDSRRVLFIGGTFNKQTQSRSFIYNVALDLWSEEANMGLPYPVQGLTASAFVQSNFANACSFRATGLSVCVPMNDTVVMIYGGTHPTKGIIGNQKILFVDPERPPKVPKYPGQGILALGYAVAGIGIGFALGAIGATVALRQNASFKSASPLFLIIYAVGSIISFIGIILYTISAVDFKYCSSALWVFSTGCMLLFSAIVVKNWRIYFIFLRSHSAKKSFLIQDPVMMAMVGFLVCINFGVLIAFNQVSPYETSIITIDGDDWPICVSKDIGKWLWILLAPVTGVLIFGLYISFKTRNVTSKYNETGQINLSIYVVTLTLVILVPLSLFIKDPSALHLINSLLVCLTLYTVIFTNFFTKIYTILSKESDTIDFSSSHGESSVDGEESFIACKLCKQSIKPAGAAKSSMNRATAVRNQSTTGGAVASSSVKA
ncbi:hypothetical protein HDU67_006008 [Dinochytrium kinnereticum]|nr:hypothetical protein HDU67_006008 [Dinochytrium kinnereticum]